MHALVLMAATGSTSAAGELHREHERFIDDLDQANKIVLGGSWRPAAAGLEAAYLLSCQSLDEARQIAAADPLVRGDAMRCQVVEWELVGVNTDAIDRSSLLYP
jgi:uncharacterized protein YciI